MIGFPVPQRDDAGRQSGGSFDRLAVTGRLILTDDGRVGRVRRVLIAPEGHGTELEVEGPDGAISLLSPRDVRFIYAIRDGNPERAA
jgi:hypothetical protein